MSSELETDGYKTQSTKGPLGNVIQAQKAGILRDIVAADRVRSPSWYPGNPTSGSLST